MTVFWINKHTVTETVCQSQHTLVQPVVIQSLWIGGVWGQRPRLLHLQNSKHKTNFTLNEFAAPFLSLSLSFFHSYCKLALFKLCWQFISFSDVVNLNWSKSPQHICWKPRHFARVATLETLFPLGQHLVWWYVVIFLLCFTILTLQLLN